MHAGRPPRLPEWPLRSRGRTAIALGAGVWLLVASLTGVGLAHERTLELDAMAQSSRALAMALEEATARTFQSVDLVLSRLVDAYRVRRPETHDPAYRELMRGPLAELPYLRAIFVIDAEGRIRHDTDYPSTPDVGLADRPYFTQYLQHPDLLRDTSEPLQSRSGVGWFNAITRRLSRAGRFEGVIVAVMRPAYLEAQFGRMGLGEGWSIDLYYRDGRLIAAYPPRQDPVGGSAVPDALFASLQDGQGPTVEWNSPDSRGRRLFTVYRAVGGQPLIVGVTQDASIVLAGWQRQVWTAITGLALFAILIAALVAQHLRQHRLAERIQERRLQAEKLEALGRLTGVVVHDIGNLLGILGNSNTLMGQLAIGNAAMERILGVSGRTLVHGRTLLDQLRSFMAHSAPAVDVVDLNAVVKSSLPLLRQAGGTGIELTVELADAPLACLADETQICMSLVNLLVNAKDAVGGSGTVWLSTFACTDAELDRYHLPRERRYFCVTLRDEGPGMPEEVRRRALDPYFTTKGKGGTGLGLAQVHGFMQQVGGDVRIDSEPGHGTSVRLFFPMRTAPDPADRPVGPESVTRGPGAIPKPSPPRTGGGRGSEGV